MDFFSSLDKKISLDRFSFSIKSGFCVYRSKQRFFLFLGDFIVNQGTASKLVGLSLCKNQIRIEMWVHIKLLTSEDQWSPQSDFVIEGSCTNVQGLLIWMTASICWWFHRCNEISVPEVCFCKLMEASIQSAVNGGTYKRRE